VSFVLLAIGVFVALVGAGMAAPPERMPLQSRMTSLEQKRVPAQILTPLLNLVQNQSQSPTEHQLNAEERMRLRFPQPVRVGDLIGLRVLDDNDVTIGIVRHVARTTEGKVLLIVAHTGPLGWGGRLVSVSIEVVAIFGRQLASLDMKPAEYASAATWTTGSTELLGTKERILIGLTKR
jgi:PRC-barrel domain